MSVDDFDDEEVCPPTERLVAPPPPVAPSPSTVELRAAELVVSERFHAYRQLAAGTAYQLEAPLAKVIANLRSALEGGLPTDILEDSRPRSVRTEGGLLDALVAAERASTIVHGLMSFAGSAEVKSDPVDVHDAIEVAIRLAQRDIHHRARLVRRFDSVPAVRTSVPKLAQVLLNLLHNAAEAIPRFSPLTNSIVIATRAEDGEVVIEISDTGVGIEDENLERVFDPFYSTRLAEDAPGLGLTAARALLLEVGGRIEIDSVFGRGTTCRVRLPAHPAAVVRSLPFVRVELPARRVLAIASDVDAGRALGDFFEDEHTIVRVASEEEALESLALGDPWDLVVFASGDECGGRLREKIGQIAPELLMRTFGLPSARREAPSGVYRRTRQVQRVAG